MVSGVSDTSLIGLRSRERTWPVVRWLAGSKERIVSSVSPKKSSRSGSPLPGTKTSRMPPRTAYSPTSRTVATRSKPLRSRRAATSSMRTWLPGRAEKARLSITSCGEILCSAALTVTSTIAACGFLRWAIRALSAASLRADVSALGDTRS
ncbi:hypothetical protein D3C87_1544330 [compost metagenome]